MKKGLISVIIPCYNQAQFLTEAVESVLNQTYINFEIIVINDGSTDNTETIANELIKKDKRIKYISQPNQGLSVSRNNGFRASKGEFIQFLDADDKIHKDKFKTQMEIFNINNDIGVSYTNYKLLNSQNEKFYSNDGTIKLKDNPLKDFLFRWERGLSIPIHCAIFKKSIFQDNNIFNTSLKAKEDWYMWIQLALNNVNFNFIDKDFAIYRVHAQSMTKDYEKMMYYMVLAVNIISEMLPIKYKNLFIDKSLEHIRCFYVNKIVEQNFLNSILCIDIGNGFDKQNSINRIKTVAENNKFHVTFDLEKFINIKRVLFCPVINVLCRLKLDTIILKSKDNEKDYSFDEIISKVNTNGKVDRKGFIRFDTLNPEIIIPLSQNVDRITINGKIILDSFGNIQLEKIYKSLTWRLGRCITWFPEKIFNLIKKFFRKID